MAMYTRSPNPLIVRTGAPRILRSVTPGAVRRQSRRGGLNNPSDDVRVFGSTVTGVVWGRLVVLIDPIR